jgi:magnesium transporter
MLKLVYLTPGSSPHTLDIQGRDRGMPVKPVITLCTYDTDCVEQIVCSHVTDAILRLKPDKNNWIDINGVGDIETVKTLGAHFELGPLIIEDILTSQRPKMESLDNGIFLVTSMTYSPKNEKDRVEVEQLSIFFTKNTLVTFQHSEKRDSFQEVRLRLNTAGSLIPKYGSDFLTYVILDTVVDNHFPVLELIGDETELIEKALVLHPSQKIIKDLFYYRRVLLEMRRGAWPQRELLSRLMHEEKGLVTETTRVFLRDSYEHITQIIDIIENYRDLTSGLMDVYHSSLSYRTNEIIRVLTLFATFFMPLTFLVGVYGMNFHGGPFNMPELGWRYGYPFFWLLMIAISALMFLYLKRKKWL